MKKQIIIKNEEIELEEGVYLVDPMWIHLDEKEVQEVLDKNQQIFRVNFEEIK